MAGGYSIGIDFGTTNSSLAILRPGSDEPELVRPHPIGDPYDQVIGTEVFFPQTGKPLVGREARNEENQLSGRDYLRNFKRTLIKQPLQRRIVCWEKDSDRQKYNYYQQCGESKIRRSTRLEGEGYNRERLIAAIAAVLESLTASEGIEDIIREAERITFGVPIAFGDLARLRLLRASRKAGLTTNWSDAFSRIRFLQEPAAIALNAFQESGTGVRRVLVYDHGGGTLDLSLLEFEAGSNGVFHAKRLLGSHGSLDVGGCRFDEAFLKKVITPVLGKRLSDSDQKKYRFWIEIFAERLKIALSKTTTAVETFPHVGELSTTRADLERSVEPLVVQSISLVKQFLANDYLGVTLNDVDVLILAGGMSCMPCIQKEIREQFPHIPDEWVFKPDPRDERSVEQALTHTARGLARYGGMDLSAERTVADIKVFDPSSVNNDNPILLKRDVDLKGSDATGNGRVGLLSEYRTGMSIYLLENHIQDDFLVGYEHIPLKRDTGDSLDIAIQVDKGQRYPRVGFRWTGSNEDYCWLKSLHDLDEKCLQDLIEQERSVIECDGCRSWTLPCSDLRLDDCVTAAHDGCLGNKAWRGYIKTIRLVSTGEILREIRRFDSREFQIEVEMRDPARDFHESDYRTRKFERVFYLDLELQPKSV